MSEITEVTVKECGNNDHREVKSAYVIKPVENLSIDDDSE